MHEVSMQQHDPETCDYCWHQRAQAQNVARDRLHARTAEMRNDPILAERWNRSQADQKTGRLYDDVQ